MHRIKLGIEKIIAGSFFLTGFLFLYFGYEKYQLRWIEWKLQNLSENTGALPYISVIIIALSYLFGTMMDTLILSFVIKSGRHFKRLWRNKVSKSKQKWIDSVGDKIDEKKFVLFLQNASDELIREYTRLRGQNILFRVTACGICFLGLCIIYWQMKIEVSLINIIFVFILFFFLTFLSVFAYIENRREYESFRKHAFNIANQKKGYPKKKIT